MVAFYNKGDQEIYKDYQFVPQEKYRTGFTAPTTEEEVTESFGIPATDAFTNSDGGYNPYMPNTSLNTTYRPNYDYRKSVDYNPELSDLQNQKIMQGTANFKGYDYYNKPELTGPQKFLQFAGSFVPGKGAVGLISPYLPVNSRRIFENELGGKGIMVNNIGQIVQGQGDYNTAENIMAGYNADLITQKTVDDRKATIKETIERKSKADPNYDPSYLNERLTALDEFGNILSSTKDESDDIYKFEKERKKKKRDNDIIGRFFKQKKQKKEDDRIAKEKADAAAKAQIERATKGQAPSDPGLRGRDDTPGFGKTSAGNYTNQFQGGDPGLMFAKGGRAGYFFGGRVNFKNGGLASIL